MSIDWSKPVQTRDGREVWLRRNEDGSVWVDPGASTYKIDGVVGGHVECWMESGRSWIDDESSSDLVNAPEPLEFWLVVRREGRVNRWNSERPARVDATRDGDTLLRLHNTTGKWGVEEVQ